MTAATWRTGAPSLGARLRAPIPDPPAEPETASHRQDEHTPPARATRNNSSRENLARFKLTD